jgi:hypothetical protein
MVWDSILIGATAGGTILGALAAVICLTVVLLDMFTGIKDPLFGVFAWGTLFWGVLSGVCWIGLQLLRYEVR